MKKKNIINELIVFLMFVNPIIFCFTSLKLLQTITEVLLLFIFMLKTIKTKFSYLEILLLVSFYFSSILSLYFNKFSVFLTDFKVYSLSIYCLIYFNRVKYKSKLLKTVLIADVIMMIIEKIHRGTFAFIYVKSKNASFNSIRFGGIFLDAHYNGAFLSYYFIPYCLIPLLSIVGFICVYFSYAKVIFGAYALQFINNKYYINAKKHSYRIFIFLLFFLVFIVFFDYIVDIIFSILNNKETFGFAQIFLQLVDIRNYKTYVLNFLPNDILTGMYLTNIPQKYGNILLSNTAVNEIGFFIYFYQMGIVTTILYFIYLFRSVKKCYWIFIIFSFIHYSFIQYPFLLYVMLIQGYSEDKSLALLRKKSDKVLSLFRLQGSL